MDTELQNYLDNVRKGMMLDPVSGKDIITELQTHAEDRYDEMKEAGLSDEEAERECIGLLGSARLVARHIYEAHSQGTWRQAMLAAVPHMFFAVLFALKWWNVGWLPVILCLTLAIAIYGWGHGKPSWLFPWLGYSLLPVVIAGLLLLYLPTGWAWATILLYIPLIIWLLSYIAIKAVNQDWLYSALMLLPVPSIVGWSLAVRPGGSAAGFNLEHLNEYAPWIGLSFLVLAMAVVIFIRLRRRRLKVIALVTSGVLTLAVVALASNRLSLPMIILLIFLMLVFLLVPAILMRRIRNGGNPALT